MLETTKKFSNPERKGIKKKKNHHSQCFLSRTDSSACFGTRLPEI